MRILFTGASSFTGAWFVRELAAAGHQVTATFRQRAEGYPDELRRRRVANAAGVVEPVFGVSFGDEAFLELLGRGGWDLLAHHAADVTNYREPRLRHRGRPSDQHPEPACGPGGAFAPPADAGCSSPGACSRAARGRAPQGLPHFSPYGLSKALTAQVFRYHCGRAGVRLGKFVIPNPFGPFEEPRYTAYLMQDLARRRDRQLRQSRLRPRQHPRLPARQGLRALRRRNSPRRASSALNPSGYVESQGAFTQRVAAEMRSRLGLPCAVELKRQTRVPRAAGANQHGHPRRRGPRAGTRRRPGTTMAGYYRRPRLAPLTCRRRCQPAQGALPEAQIFSSCSRSRWVSMQAQKPRCL